MRTILSDMFSRKSFSTWMLLELAAFGTLLALAAYHSYFHRFFTVDDTYITYRYAWNWAHGLGPVFNAGERVEGTSNFLYMAILTLFHTIGFDLETLGIAVGVLSYLLLIAALVFHLRTHVPSQPFCTSLGAGLVLAASTPLALWSQGGLETLFFAFLLFVAILTYLAYVRKDIQSPLSPMILFGLVALTRPEGFAYAVVIMGLECLRKLVIERESPKDTGLVLLKQLGGFLAVVGPFLLFRILYYGDVLPNTVAAKDGFQQQLFRSELLDWPRLIWQSPGVNKVLHFFTKHFSPILFPLAILPTLLVKKRRFEFLVWSSIILLSLAVIVWAKGDWMQHFRLFTPIIAPCVVLIALGLSEALDWAGRRPWVRRWPHWGQQLAAIGFLAILFLFFSSHALYERKFNSWKGNRHEAMRTLGKQLQSIAQPDDLLAIGFIGRVPYGAPDLRVVDILGLTDREIAHSKARGSIYGKQSLHLVAKRNPTFWVAKEPSGRRSFLRLRNFKKDYVEIQRPTSKKDRLFVFVKRTRPGIKKVAKALHGKVSKIK